MLDGGPFYQRAGGVNFEKIILGMYDTVTGLFEEKWNEEEMMASVGTLRWPY